MKCNWQISDILDLEFFFHQDQEKNEKELQKRDRAIALRACESSVGNDNLISEDYLLRSWLQGRRRQYGDQVRLPGQIFTELLGICGCLFLIGGFLVGGGMAWSFLAYAGITPVNASMYIVLFVVSQVILLGLIPFSFFAAKLRGHQWLPFTSTLLRRGIIWLSARIGRGSLSGESRQWFAALSGQLRRQKKVYGSLFMLPFFRIIQLLGIGFNLGVLAATLLKVTTTDIAFGWQSTLAQSAGTVYNLVQIIALPWSWLLPAGTGHPDLDQIEGSHLILKEGIYYLSSDALVSWWPFLCMAVLVYGLLPRVFLLFFASLAKRTILTRLCLDSGLHQQVIRRMRTPAIATEAEADHDRSVSFLQSRSVPMVETNVAVEPAAFTRTEQALALIPEELYDDCQSEVFIELIRGCAGREPGKCLMLEDELEIDLLVENIKNELGSNESILFLQEAWQPPIEEFFAFLRQLRSQIGEKVLITVCLIGRPVRETIFTPVREHEYGVWKQKLTGMGDPWLQCICLVECEQ